VLTLAIGTTSALHARAPGDESALVLDDPKATLIDKTTGTYRIDATGKLTLGKNDTWSGFTIEFKDPTGKTPAPTLVKFKQPAPGATEDFHYKLITTTNGLWTIKVRFDFNTGNPPAPGLKVESKSVSLR
jgi:hypothetical protein